MNHVFTHITYYYVNIVNRNKFDKVYDPSVPKCFKSCFVLGKKLCKIQSFVCL